MTLSHDHRFAVRQLWRAPVFSLTVILTLAFGIGANLAIFQVLYGVIFQNLPIAEPKQLYSLRAVKSPYDGQWFFSYPAYQHLRQVTTAVPVIARTSISECIFQPNGRSPERAGIQLVSDNFFDVLGISPAAGRFFFTDHEAPGQDQWPAVLRYGFWKQFFGEDLSVIGKRAVVNGVPVIIVGVAPERFSGVVAGSAPDLWLPLGAQASGRLSFWFDSLGPGSGANIRASYLNQQSVFWLWLLARVPDTAKSSALSNWTQVLQPDIALLATTATDTHDRARILQSRVELISAASGEGTLREEYSQSLAIMMVMAGLVLLIGCVNLASLQLARLLSRQRELAVRMSLGAGRWSLLRLLLAENLLLALIGGVLALALGRVSSSVLLRWASGAGRTIAVDLHIGWELFALCVVLLVLALIGFSALPAWHITRNHPAAAIQSKSGTSQSRTARNWSSALLAGQVSFSLLLLGMAVLFAQTLVNLIHVDAGVDRDHVVSVHLDLENANYRKADLPDYYSRLLEQLKTLPAVRQAAVSMCAIPGCIWNTAIHVSGHPEIPEKQMHGEENYVGAGYFHTLGIPILQGRDFGEQDRQTSQRVAILNHAFARQLFGDETPIGHRIGYEAAPHDADYLIVGKPPMRKLTACVRLHLPSRSFPLIKDQPWQKPSRFEAADALGYFLLKFAGVYLLSIRTFQLGRSCR